MNRHLRRVLTFATLLVIPLLNLRAQNNLKLELDGPFALCETANNLEIWMPDLHDTHYVPGFRSAFREYPLDYSGKYSSLDMRDLVHPGGLMTLVPATLIAKHSSALYHEYQAGGCQGTPVVKFSVPKPDEIWPEAPADEIEQVKNETGTAYLGHWGAGGGKYVTRVVLKYKNVDLSATKVYGGPGGPWDLDVAEQGEDAKITLEVVPIAQGYTLVSHAQSAIAFELVSAKAGWTRHLCFKADPTPCPTVSVKTQKQHGKTSEQAKHIAKPRNVRIETSSTAKDCHAPPILICNEQSSDPCKP
jgi:hypothetical protein